MSLETIDWCVLVLICACVVVGVATAVNEAHYKKGVIDSIYIINNTNLNESHTLAYILCMEYQMSYGNDTNYINACMPLLEYVAEEIWLMPER